MEKPSRRKFLVGILVLVVLVLPLCPAFEYTGPPMEEGALLVYPELILKGQLPYRDFETFYGPANIALLAGVYAVTGSSIFVERAIGLLYRVLIFGAFFALIQRWNMTLAAGCTMIACLLFIPLGIPAYAWIGAVACALWSLWLISQIHSARACFFGGILAAGALLFRPDLAPAMMLSGLPLFLRMKAARRWKYLYGIGLGLLPFAALTAVVGPREILNNLFLFPVFYSSVGRHLPIFSAEPYVIRLFFMHIAAVVINLLAGGLIVTRRYRADISTRVVLSLALLGLGLTHQAAQRLDFGHVVCAALLSIPVLPLSLWMLCAQWRESAFCSIRAAAASLLVMFSLFFVAPRLFSELHRKSLASLDPQGASAVFLEYQGRSFPIPSGRLALDMSELLKHMKVMAKPGERLFVGPADLRRTNYNGTFVYHLLPQLLPATYFLEMNPLSANRPNSRLSSDVASADWLVLDHSWDDWNEANESTKFGTDAPMEVVKSQFQLFGRFGVYDLYRRRVPSLVRN
jgi:hypothetical protein